MSRPLHDTHGAAGGSRSQTRVVVCAAQDVSRPATRRCPPWQLPQEHRAGRGARALDRRSTGDPTSSRRPTTHSTRSHIGGSTDPDSGIRRHPSPRIGRQPQCAALDPKWPTLHRRRGRYETKPGRPSTREARRPGFAHGRLAHCRRGDTVSLRTSLAVWPVYLCLNTF